MIAETGGKQPVIWVVNWRVVLHHRLSIVLLSKAMLI